MDSKATDLKGHGGAGIVRRGGSGALSFTVQVAFSTSTVLTSQLYS